MSDYSVRIENIIIENFKNVKRGSISLENKRKDYRASVVGLYGQNGSGKTALIDAIALLKLILCGKKVPLKYADYINVDADAANLSFQFKLSSGKEVCDLWYEFSVRKAAVETDSNMNAGQSVSQYKAEIFNEVLSFSFPSLEKRTRKSPLIDTRPSAEIFIPKKNFQELLGDEKANMPELQFTKRYVQATSKSFIFSGEMIQLFEKNCKNEKYMALIRALVLFGNTELFTIHTKESGLISMNVLPLAFRYNKRNAETVGNMLIKLDEPADISNEDFELFSQLIRNMNIVLEQIVPGLTMKIRELGPVFGQDGTPKKRIQLMSRKNEKEIPFQYESEGIKKIVSVLQLLIAMYNNASVTVAIDEMDSGIFEYLLGEILHILSEKGKGQLIFTSHNLRPLETLDKGFIAFTTANPENRYVRMVNVKGNNNLRDFYYRDIVLGEQSEPLYIPTDNFDIALAFREAGEIFGA